MRVLILGGDGMLGSRLVRSLRAAHEVWAAVRRDPGAYEHLRELLRPEATAFEVEVRRPDCVLEVLSRARPDAVINAVGIVKQRREAQDAAACLEVNALFPHRLATMCRAAGARLIHISTDCVFSGKRGRYREDDPADAEDLYGRTKLLGEPLDSHCLTLRTSLVGLEVGGRRGLIEWFLASKGVVSGFRRAVFSGLTTLEMARLVDLLLSRHAGLSGLWHVASAPVDKYTLLCAFARELGRGDVRIEADDSFACDRSLVGEAFEAATGYRPPSWEEMLRELAGEARAREEGTCS